MAKKKSSTKNERRSQSRYKKAVDHTPDQIRAYAAQIEAIARRIHCVADDMLAADIKIMSPIPQSIETHCEKLSERVEIEFENRLKLLVQRKARKEAKEGE